MFIRLAMVACFGPHDGPWLRARGNEVGIRVEHLGVGEYVSVEYQNGSSQTNSYLISSPGDFPTPEAFKRIRFRKLGGVKPTTVALLVNG
jgi:hypothetical protein